MHKHEIRQLIHSQPSSNFCPIYGMARYPIHCRLSGGMERLYSLTNCPIPIFIFCEGGNMIEIIDSKVFIDGKEICELTVPEMQGVQAYISLLFASRLFKGGH